MDKEYICLFGEETFTEDELHICPKCGEFSCPTCGGEVQTVKENELAVEVGDAMRKVGEKDDG